MAACFSRAGMPERIRQENWQAAQPAPLFSNKQQFAGRFTAMPQTRLRPYDCRFCCGLETKRVVREVPVQFHIGVPGEPVISRWLKKLLLQQHVALRIHPEHDLPVSLP